VIIFESVAFITQVIGLTSSISSGGRKSIESCVIQLQLVHFYANCYEFHVFESRFFQTFCLFQIFLKLRGAFSIVNPLFRSDNATPLLVAASHGALITLKFLIGRGARVTARDVNDDGPVQRAALNFHADVIEYFVQLTEEDANVADVDTLHVWEKLVGEMFIVGQRRS